MTHRILLGNLPTPIQNMPRLSETHGKNLYIKRDDYSGTEYSGNKIRKLEFVLADAISQGCDAVVTCGGIQSNHCRATSAACARLGLACHTVLRGEAQAFEGNLFLDTMLGAKVHLIAPTEEYPGAMEKVADALRREGKKPYLIPVGASTPIGALGYLEAWNEILAWEKANQTAFDAVCIAVGSGGSYAGLWQGNAQSGGEKLIAGFAVSNDSGHFQGQIQEILKGMGVETSRESITILDGYVGLGYAQATREEIARYMDIARLEGIVLDPCYTGKAFLGMLEEMEHGILQDKENILFVHTGGIMGWTQQQRDMAAGLARQQERIS